MISFNYVSPYTSFQHAVIQSVKNIGGAIVPPIAQKHCKSCPLFYV